MENEDFYSKQTVDFSFLQEEEVQAHFADLNIALLRGRHIQQDDLYSHRLLNSYQEELSYYYNKLYGLVLCKDKKDNETYYYLEFPDNGRGKLSGDKRHKELTDPQVIFGLVLLKMYYDHYFEHEKEIHWEDIRHEITEGEYQVLFKKAFFDGIRDFYTHNEWSGLKKTFTHAIKNFEQLGWVEKLQSEDGENISFRIKVAIHRLAKLYEEEIKNFDLFIEKYHSNEKT